MYGDYVCTGRLLEMKLVGCDGDKRQDGSAPDIVLKNNWSSPEMRNTLLLLWMKLHWIAFR